MGGDPSAPLYRTAVAGIPQHLAQGINLLYFLPTASTAPSVSMCATGM